MSYELGLILIGVLVAFAAVFPRKGFWGKPRWTGGGKREDRESGNAREMATWGWLGVVLALLGLVLYAV
ncbi:hypothetical protein [Nocardioides sp.]|uniref:hypothetical protein n=1 Tax=Nocardioides sp. TaxID=35761 RepID=UPI002C7C6170|nr:hypothetical protein [Nocardioides sp.]HXH79119.1 hypothetical protein [Nocardioides sp.]